MHSFPAIVLQPGAQISLVQVERFPFRDSLALALILDDLLLLLLPVNSHFCLFTFGLGFSFILSALALHIYASVHFSL